MAMVIIMDDCRICGKSISNNLCLEHLESELFDGIPKEDNTGSVFNKNALELFLGSSSNLSGNKIGKEMGSKYELRICFRCYINEVFGWMVAKDLDMNVLFKRGYNAGDAE